MALTTANYNLAAERQDLSMASEAFKRLGTVARVIASEEAELLVRKNLMPYKNVTVPSVPAFDRRAFTYRPGRGRNQIDLLGVGAYSILPKFGWIPKVGWEHRTWLPYMVPVDPETKMPMLMVNMHLLNDAPRGSARAQANDLIIKAVIDLVKSMGMPAQLLGDWNREPKHPGNNPLRKAGFEFVSPGPTHGRPGKRKAIDYSAVIGLEVLSARVLDGYLGDHDPVRYRIRVPKR